MSVGDRYFMDDPREAQRLIDKVDADAWVQRYYGQHLPTHGSVLEVGCGPGELALAVTRLRPEVDVVGVDLSSERIQLARERCSVGRPRFEIGAAESLPFADASFDFVYSRFLFEYLPDKHAAAAEILRVLKPGGKVVLQDLDGQLIWHEPPEPVLHAMIAKVLGELARTGFDPMVGRKLFGILRGAGARELAVGVSSYHLIVGSIDAESERLWRLKLDIARPAIERCLGREQAAEMIARFMAFLRDPSTLTYSVLFTVVGRKP